MSLEEAISAVYRLDLHDRRELLAWLKRVVADEDRLYGGRAERTPGVHEFGGNAASEPDAFEAAVRELAGRSGLVALKRSRS